MAGKLVNLINKQNRIHQKIEEYEIVDIGHQLSQSITGLGNSLCSNSSCGNEHNQSCTNESCGGGSGSNDMCYNKSCNHQ